MEPGKKRNYMVPLLFNPSLLTAVRGWSGVGVWNIEEHRKEHWAVSPQTPWRPATQLLYARLILTAFQYHPSPKASPSSAEAGLP